MSARSRSSEARNDPLTLVNARIHTMDPTRPRAGSLSIVAGRIAAIDPPTPIGQVVDLGGHTLLPGLIDAHLHCVLGGETLAQLDLSGAHGREDVSEAIAQRAARLAPEEWLIARGWNEDRFREPGLPDATWLRAAGDRPCVAWRMDIHACVVNDALLRVLAARHDLSVDPSGGRIQRDARGRPTGLFQEAAAWQLVMPLQPSPPEATQREGFRAAQRFLAQLGITSVGSMEYAKVAERVVLPERDHLDVRMRITLLDREWPLDLSFARSFANDETCAVIGMKAFVDGTFGSRTARMLEPYADDAGNRGIFVELAERGVLLEWIRHVRTHGLSPSMHAIGDEAVRLALEVVEASDGPNAPPARIEHAQTTAPGDVVRFGRGRERLFVSMQPLHKRFDAHAAATRLTTSRMPAFFPFRSLAHAGARIAFGSDWPVVSPDPIEGMAAAITGLDSAGHACRPEENLGVHETLRAYTSTAAECLGLDAGVLALGRFADFTVVDVDPYSCDWVRRRPQVLRTIMGGRTTFER